MSMQYEYQYAILRASDGLCRGIEDTSTYVLDPTYVPILDDSINWAFKYYYPMPDVDSLTSFADFQGLFYLDAAHTQPFDEGNAALRHED